MVIGTVLTGGRKENGYVYCMASRLSCNVFDKSRRILSNPQSCNPVLPSASLLCWGNAEISAASAVVSVRSWFSEASGCWVHIKPPTFAEAASIRLFNTSELDFFAPFFNKSFIRLAIEKKPHLSSTSAILLETSGEVRLFSASLSALTKPLGDVYGSKLQTLVRHSSAIIAAGGR